MDKSLVEYFINETNAKFEKLESKVDDLLRFKWQIIGGSLFMSVFVTVAINTVALLIK